MGCPSIARYCEVSTPLEHIVNLQHLSRSLMQLTKLYYWLVSHCEQLSKIVWILFMQEIISDCSIKDHLMFKILCTNWHQREGRRLIGRILKYFKVSAAFERFEVVSSSGTMREVNHAPRAKLSSEWSLKKNGFKWSFKTNLLQRVAVNWLQQKRMKSNHRAGWPQMHRTSTIVDQSRYRSPPSVLMEIVNC